jgi:hypothetical protein
MEADPGDKMGFPPGVALKMVRNYVKLKGCVNFLGLLKRAL